MITTPRILPKKEITKLITDYQKTKNIKSRDRVVMNNIKLVYTIANKYGSQNQANGYSLDDFISEGVIGLMQAIDKFDTSKGISFTTYAYWWIKKSMTKTLTVGTLNIPQHRLQLLNKYQKLAEVYLDAGKPPDTKTIAKTLNVSERILIDTISQSSATVSIDNANVIAPKFRYLSVKGNNHEESRLIDHLDFKNIWRKAKRELKPEEIKVLEDRLGLEGNERTLEEIATELSVSKEWVRKLYGSGIKKIKIISKRKKWQ